MFVEEFVELLFVELFVELFVSEEGGEEEFVSEEGGSIGGSGDCASVVCQTYPDEHPDFAGSNASHPTYETPHRVHVFTSE